MPRQFIAGQAEWLETQGFTWEMIDRAGRRAQYYKADGTPLRNTLPADPYHLQLYRRKGWTLTPPPPPSTPDTVVLGMGGLQPSGVAVAAATPPLYISDKQPKPKRKRRAKKE